MNGLHLAVINPATIFNFNFSNQAMLFFMHRVDGRPFTVQ